MGVAIEGYEKEAAQRARGKIEKSREAAVLLHSAAALAEAAGVTRVEAAKSWTSCASWGRSS